MKTLVVYYSLSGNTKKIAEEIAKELKCDIEEIIDLKNRKGFFGYILAGFDAVFGRKTKIKEIHKKPVLYDLVIIGTPIWGSNMCPAVRTFISENEINFRRNVAFFSTFGGGSGKSFSEMETLSGRRPVAVLGIKASDVKNNNYINKLKDFVKVVKQKGGKKNEKACGCS